MNEKIHPSNKKTIVLIGMMGAGKTTTGFSIAQRLNLKFVDSDKEIEKLENLTVEEVIEQKGEEYYKKLEKKIISDFLNNNQPQILSIGGNSFENDEIRKMIKEKAISIFIDVDYPILLERVKKKNTRPILEKGNKEEILKKLYDEKLPYYKKADIVINTTYLNKDTSLNVILSTIAQYIRDYDFEEKDENSDKE